MTKQETAQLMEAIRIAYPGFYAKSDAASTAKAVELWAELFKDYPLEIVACAVKVFIESDTKGFPPVIGQIRALINDMTITPYMDEAEAWNLVMDKVRCGNYHAAEGFWSLPPMVQKIIGSHTTIKRWAGDPDFNEAVESSNFKRAYRAEVEKDRKEKSLSPTLVRQIAKARNDLWLISQENNGSTGQHNTRALAGLINRAASMLTQ